MCRSTTTTTTTTRRDSAELPSHPEDRDSFKIRAFCLRLWVAEDFRGGGGGGGGGRRAVPGDLTLAYLPRTDGGALEVNESKVRDGAPAVVALHCVRPGEPRLLFASADRVRVGDGARFEACAGEEEVVRGVFRRVGGGGGGGGGGAGWRMECRGCEAAVAAEVWAVGESGAVLRERVEIAAEEVGTRRRRRTTLGLGFRPRLEEIPEESDGCDRSCSCSCCCCCCCGDGADVRERGRSDSEVVVGLDGWDRRGEEGMEGGDWGLDMEGVRWAVDVGIWVVCLGVGLLVSRASSGSLRRKRHF